MILLDVEAQGKAHCSFGRKQIYSGGVQVGDKEFVGNVI